MTPREHGRLLGLLFLIWAGFQFIGTLAAGLMMTVMDGPMMAEFSKIPRRAGEPDPSTFIGLIFGAVVVGLIVSLLFLIPDVVAGLGLRRERASSRIWAIVASILALLSFPLGTALGVYGLWFVFGEQGRAFFGNNSGYPEQPAPPPHSWR
jgi:hypothetical protein